MSLSFQYIIIVSLNKYGNNKLLNHETCYVYIMKPNRFPTVSEVNMILKLGIKISTKGLLTVKRIDLALK